MYAVQLNKPPELTLTSMNTRFAQKTSGCLASRMTGRRQAKCPTAAHSPTQSCSLWLKTGINFQAGFRIVRRLWKMVFQNLEVLEISRSAPRTLNVQLGLTSFER